MSLSPSGWLGSTGILRNALRRDWTLEVGGEYGDGKVERWRGVGGKDELGDESKESRGVGLYLKYKFTEAGDVYLCDVE